MRSVDELNQLYGPEYYQTHCARGCHLPYERNEHWLGFFGRIADEIVHRLRPASALDVGCAMGFLVEALHARGVDAHGIDVSETAVGEAHESVADRVRVGSLLDPVEGTFDLVTCIEVLEHLPAAETDAAVARLTSLGDRILVSSTPDDFVEPTHVNVRPPEFWAAAFAAHGFVVDLDFDASFLTPWAVLYVRRDPAVVDVVRAYERERWRLQRERDALREHVLTELQTTPAASPDEVADLRRRLREAIDAAHGADARRATVEARLAHVEYALSAAHGREDEIAEMIDQIYATANGDVRRLQALLDARSFRWYWRLSAPRRWWHERRAR